MFPILIDFGCFSLKTYGAMMAAGFFLCWMLVEKLTGRKDLSNLLTGLMLSGVVGARLAYVIEHWSAEFAARPLDALRIWTGGLMFYGGFILALVFFFGWCYWRHENPVRLADVAAVVVPLGHAMGRIGCFCYGCCYGRLSDSCLAVRFPAHSSAWYEQLSRGLIAPTAKAALPVLPTQLIEAALLLALFAGLLFLYRRTRRHTAGVYMIGYGVIRFGVEFLRDDPVAGVGALRIGQAISLGVIALGGVFLWRSLRAARRESTHG